MNRFWLAIAFVTSLFAAQTAAAQTLTAANPLGIVTQLQSMGYRATLDTDSDGDPRIRSAIAGANYTIFFYGCRNNINCTGIRFNTGFNLTNGTTMQVMNDWNYNRLTGRAYLDPENDPFLDFFVVTMDGISVQVFERVLARWELAVEEFQTHIDF